MPQRVTRSRMVDIRNSAVRPDTRPDAETIQEGLSESEVQRNDTIPSVTSPAPLPVTNIATHGIDAPHAMTGVDLNSDNPSLKDILRAIYTTHNQTSMSLKNIDGRLSELETSLEFAHAQAYKNKNSIEALQSENRSLTDRVNGLSSELNTLRSEIKQIKDKHDASERRSREWGIRVYGVPELPKEDTRHVLSNLVAKHSLAKLNTPLKASHAIEHCHRLGPAQPGKHRPIIANLYSRPLRNLLLKDAKTVNNDSSGIYFSEDLTKVDHELKMRARQQMKAAHDAGRKVCFRRGKLIIDSQVTAITGVNG